MRDYKHEIIREKVTEFYTICWYSHRDVGDVFYLVLRHKEDKDAYSKKGDIKVLYVWMANYDFSTERECEDFFDWFDDEHFENLDFIKQSEPLLVGKLYGRDFYFAPELMTGTPTDETQPTDFIEVLIDFKEIARKVEGVPVWDDERIFFKRKDDRFEFELNT